MILDVIIILFIVLSVYLGYKKGFAELAIKLVALIVALLVTFFLYKPIATFVINNTQIDETIQNIIYEKAIDTINNKNSEDNQQTTSQNFYENAIMQQITADMLPETARTIAINIIQFGVLIILFIIVKIAIICIKSFAKLLASLPIIKQCDKVGGILYGLLRGLLIVYVFFALMTIVNNVNNDNVIYTQIQQSYVSKVIYNNNIITMLFENK